MSTKQELKQARQLIAKGQHDDALPILDLILEYEDDNVPALLLKGVCLQRSRNFDDALKVIANVLKLQPENTMAWRSRAAVYMAQQNAPEMFNASLETLCLLSRDLDNLKKQGKCSDSEINRIHAQAHDVFTKARLQVKRNDTAVLERLYELQSELPADLIKEPEIEKRTLAHELLQSLSPSVCEPQALAKLTELRLGDLEKSISRVDQRQKSTVNFTIEKALIEKEKLLHESKVIGLLSLHIAQEEEDSARRRSEASLLKLLTMELKNAVQLSSGPKHKKLTDKIPSLQQNIRDLAERMAMFQPNDPLAFELAWDFEDLSTDSILADLRQLKAESNKNKKKSRSRQESNSGNSNSSSRRSSVENESSVSNAKKECDVSGRSSRRPSKNSDDSKTQSKVSYFVESFPNDGLSKVMSYYLLQGKAPSARLKGALSYRADSVLGWRLAATELIECRYYEESIDAAQSGLRSINIRERVYGMAHLTKYRSFFQLVLAQAYTHYQSPKNWELAVENFDSVLQETSAEDPENLSATLGKGTLLAKMGHNEEAMALLEHAVSLDPNNLEARSNLSWLYILRGDRHAGIDGLENSLSKLNPPSLNAEICWRIGYAIWTLPESDDDRENSYEYFVKSIEYQPTHAPSYTYLGLFYDELVGDQERAQRCFYIALEHDSGEILAAEKLAMDFASNSQWDLVEAVANTVLSSPRAKSDKSLDWPYRALGIVCLNQLNFVDAVKYFQKCLRSANQDVLAWVGLGEAYIYSGRYRSAEKALTRALKLQPHNFSAWYVLSLAQREMLQFPQSAASLQSAIAFSPAFSPALQWAMADNSLRAADYLVGQSQLQDALKELKTALSAIFTTFEHEAEVENNCLAIFYGSAAEVCVLLQRFGYKALTELPSDLFSPLELVGQFQSLMLPGVKNSISLSELATELATEFVARTADDTKPRRVSAHAIAALCQQNCQNVESAAAHYKAAIQLEPRNDELWNSYGVCLTKCNPEVAQHCFVRALSLNGRNADIWINLSALYLVVQDYELALEAVDRALSLEPEHPRAWIAQALAEQALGTRENDQLYRTLSYAYEMSNNDQLASLALALKEYELRPEEPSTMAIGALEKLMSLNSGNKTAELILGLLLERKQLYEASLHHLLPLGEWTHVARVQLALEQYEDALGSAHKVLQQEKAPTVDRLSALIVSGLAYFFLNNLDSAIETFTEALDLSKNTHEDVLRLLVEVLYASMDADAQQVAQEQLFDSISEKGSTLQVVLLLGALGFTNQDEIVNQAARQELEALITPELQGEQLAQACHILQLLDPTNKSFQRAVFHWPTDYNLWRRVSPQQALVLAEGQTSNPSQLSRALVEATVEIVDNETAKTSRYNLQRAVFYEPGSEAAWQALAGAFDSAKKLNL